VDIKPTIIKDMGVLPFKINPTASNSITVSFNYDAALQLDKVILKQDTTTLQTASLGVNHDLYAYTTAIQYQFDSSISYNMLVQSKKIGDTIYQYHIPAYQPAYVSTYKYQKLFGVDGNNMIYAYDITPSRNYLFVSVDTGMGLMVKRISLQTFAVDTVSRVVDGLSLRAISDNELLIQTGYYNNRFLAEDSSALLRYNVITGKSKFLTWVSWAYGRTSRVVNNYVWVTNPIFKPGTTMLINLADNSKTVFPGNRYDFTGIREYNYDHLYYFNKVMDINSGNAYTPIAVGDSASVEYIDDKSGYQLVSTYSTSDDKQSSSTKLGFYKSGQLAYTSGYETNRTVYIPKTLQVNNDVVTYYQNYSYDTTVRIDGYYTADIKNKQTQLVQCDFTHFLMADFQMPDNSIISVRTDGVYRLSK